jgi:hypothetical protein
MWMWILQSPASFVTQYSFADCDKVARIAGSERSTIGGHAVAGETLAKLPLKSMRTPGRRMQYEIRIGPIRQALQAGVSSDRRTRSAPSAHAFGRGAAACRFNACCIDTVHGSVARRRETRLRF